MTLYCGDNLAVLRRDVETASVHLCYIDPPFNSNRNYGEFTDKWCWDGVAISGFAEISANNSQPQLDALLKGLRASLAGGPLLAYLVSIALRITEIHRVLSPTGSFFLHCDPSASHYLKIILDAIFVPMGGSCLNEIVWCYSQGGRSKSNFPKKHDTIFWYAKGKSWTFNDRDIRIKYEMLSEKSSSSFTKTDEDGRKYKSVYGPGKLKLYTYYEDEGKVPYDWWTDIHQMTGRTAASGNEYLGYPTQKPEALLERLILAASNEGDVVLDAYCGSGTTVAVARRLKRSWIGIDHNPNAVAISAERMNYSVVENDT